MPLGFSKEDSIGQEVVIIGGGEVGFEIADFLTTQDN
jgi:NADPH-dependent 2,4-dienoyl-CoA reductase/sulfur reductase-like enzyme